MQDLASQLALQGQHVMLGAASVPPLGAVASAAQMDLGHVAAVAAGGGLMLPSSLVLAAALQGGNGAAASPHLLASLRAVAAASAPMTSNSLPIGLPVRISAAIAAARQQQGAGSSILGDSGLLACNSSLGNGGLLARASSPGLCLPAVINNPLASSSIIATLATKAAAAARSNGAGGRVSANGQ
jgi:hypothetical protein